MQIHELNTLGIKPVDTDFLAIDTGFDTAKISAPKLLEPKINRPIDEGGLYDNGTEGQLLRTKGDGSTEWSDYGLPTDEQTEEAISNWLDDHPEATTTVLDDSIGLEKLTPTVEEAFNSMTMDREFVANGGVFGSVNSSQRTTNASVLTTLFNKYYSLSFGSYRQIEVDSFSALLADHSVLRNFDLICYGSNEYVFSVNHSAKYIEVDNVSMTNAGTITYGFKLGAADSSLNAASANILHLTLGNFVYPLVLFGYNCNISRLQCYKCTFGAVLMGTSINCGALYANGCTHGYCLGTYPDISDSPMGDDANVYLLYSNIGIISVDTGGEGGVCKCIVGLGKVLYCSIGAIAGEGSQLENVLYSYSVKGFVINVDEIRTTNSFATGGLFYSNLLAKEYPDFITVINLFTDYLTNALEISNNLILRIYNYDAELFRIPNIENGVHVPVNYDDFVELGNTTIGHFSSLGGSPVDVRAFTSIGKTGGVVSAGQSIKIKLKGARTTGSADTAITKREIAFLGHLRIGNADEYNSVQIFDETLLNLAIDNYQINGSYTVAKSKDNSNLNITVDSSGDYPVVTITPVNLSGKNYNYLYMLDFVGGGKTYIKVE